MRTGFKILISLVISLGFFTGLVFLKISGYKSIIETEIYQPAVLNAVYDNLGKIAESLEQWHSKNKKEFSGFIENEAVKRCVRQEQSSLDIKMVSDASVKLISSVPGLTGIRIIDGETQKIHFSTISTDILNSSDTLISYTKYGKDEKDVPFQFISVGKEEQIKITADSNTNSFLYSFPFFDSYDTYRGIAVFYVSEKAFLKKLISEKTLSLTDNLTLLSDSIHSTLGILTGMPYSSSQELKPRIISTWKNSPEVFNIVSLNNNDEWILVSRPSSFGYTGQICEKTLFLFPPAVKYFLTFAAGITVFLISFLLLNIKQDKFDIVHTKIQKLHLAILQNYIKNSESKNRKELQQELEYRRHDANSEIKKGLGKRFLKKNGKKVDEFLQKNWEEIFSVINGKFAENEVKAKNASSDSSGLKIDNEELAALLRQIIAESKSGNFNAANTSFTKSEREAGSAHIEELKKTEEAAPVEDLEEAAPIEELEEAAPIEELEEAESVEELKEAPVEEIEEAEALEAIEEFEEAAPVEDLEATPAEELKAEPIEELEEAEPLENLEEIKNEKTQTGFGGETKSSPENLEELAEVCDLEPLKKEDASAEELVELDNAEPFEELAAVDKVVKTVSLGRAESSNEQDKQKPEIIIEEFTEDLPDFNSPESFEEIPVSGEDKPVKAVSELDAAELVEDLTESDLKEIPVIEELKEFDGAMSSDDINLDDPMQLLNATGYTISGLDFSDLNIPISEIKSAEDEIEAEEVRYLDGEYDFQKAMWGRYREANVKEFLEISGGLEILPLLDEADERTIINEGGIFVIKKNEGVEPANKDFKALVDSVLK
ncbi:hypothetical protein [Treponema pedis]|uniref:hypothetical protein n=1 Tax=Treponema pedis TaxID=409322 RepID=UPI0003FD1736|nr:hypothetical protein [Treponema pedis]